MPWCLWFHREHLRHEHRGDDRKHHRRTITCTKDGGSWWEPDPENPRPDTRPDVERMT